MPKLICPCCSAEISVDVDFTNVRQWEARVDSADAWKLGLTAEQIAFAERADADGLVDAMMKAHLAGQHGASVPRFPKRFFVGFFKTATPKRIPQFALDIFVDRFGGRIEFLSAQGTGLVISDRKPKMFVPLNFVSGTSLRGNTGGGKLRLDTDHAKLIEWVRTKMGYVPNTGLFADEMKRKSYGEFARPAM